MKLSISIMAHPSRDQWVEEIRKQVGGCPVAFDAGCGIISNCATAWLLRNDSTYNGESDYHCVLQDDAVPCRNFRKRAEKLLASFSAPTAVSFYMGKRGNLGKEQAAALRQGHCFGPLRWGVAVCLPVAWITPMLRSYKRQTSRQDDNRIRRWLTSQHQQVYYPVPSLVNHREGPSLVGDPGSQRVAYRFIDDK
jgi:hypothetical protein